MKLWAIHSTTMTKPASPIRPIVGEMTCASTNAAGSARSAMTQNNQKHVMVPTLLVMRSAIALIEAGVSVMRREVVRHLAVHGVAVLGEPERRPVTGLGLRCYISRCHDREIFAQRKPRSAVIALWATSRCPCGTLARRRP